MKLQCHFCGYLVSVKDTSKKVDCVACGHVNTFSMTLYDYKRNQQANTAKRLDDLCVRTKAYAQVCDALMLITLLVFTVSIVYYCLKL